ncbi:hypothetical protein GH733_018821 [Mirounga leonina]|nr:hypothetical protein GH733_018821 [Mirounga leonina]
MQTLAGSSQGHPRLSWVGRRGPAARTARWPGLSLGPVWVPPAAHCSVIGRRADLGPPLPPPRLCPLCGREGDSLSGEEQLETWRASLRGRGTEPSLPPAPAPPAPGGTGQGEGHRSFTGKVRGACTGHPPRLARRSVQGCVPWSGCSSLLGTCSLNSLPPRLSARQEIEVPAPRGRPPCLPGLPGASPRRGPSTRHQEPPFRRPLGRPVGAVSHRGPFGAQVGGRRTVLTKASSPPEGKKHFCGGISFVDIGHRSIFLFRGKLLAGMFSCLPGIPGSLPDQLSC